MDNMQFDHWEGNSIMYKPYEGHENRYICCMNVSNRSRHTQGVSNNLQNKFANPLFSQTQLTPFICTNN